MLGIPIVKDRILHTAIKRVLEPIIDPTFSDNSYGFRPGRNQQQAVEKAREIVRGGNEQIVDIDLSKFFDRINHDRLIHRLKPHAKDKRILRLIGMILRSGIMTEGVVTPSTEGSVQGGLCKALHKEPYAKKVIMQSKSDKSLKMSHPLFFYFA